MARKSAKPKHVEPEEQETDGKAISKAEAVRQALAAGNDSPEDGVGYLKSIHGIEMTRQSFSSYKAQEKARQEKKGAKGKPGRKPKAAIEGYLAPPPKPATDGQAELLAAIEAMKPLVEALGAEKVKRIADLLVELVHVPHAANQGCETDSGPKPKCHTLRQTYCGQLLKPRSGLASSMAVIVPPLPICWNR